ncbi:immunoglobulin lambda-like polypeptide 1 isoform X1 [Pseudophryne corroboree]|uniref:immunoglobulin lambda-like polypeptide 1 isoform X1 n=1 Tax=Pseudophryne corroboree TaxID=495146 RepID=UPI0030818ADB
MISLQSVCLLLSTLVTVSQAQHSVTQDPPVITETAGKNVRMSCTLGGGLTVSGNRVVFIQQTLSNKPRFILYYFTESSKGKGDGVPARFVGSASGNIGYLDISGAQPEDEAVYYCATWTGSQYLFGGGTQLNIITGEVKPPSVFIYRASEEEMKTNKATTVCAVSDYTPNTVTVEWQVDGVKWTNGVHTSMVSKQRDNTYMQSSLLTMSSSEYTKHNDIACKVTHQGKDIVKTVKRSECV